MNRRREPITVKLEKKIKKEVKKAMKSPDTASSKKTSIAKQKKPNAKKVAAKKVSKRTSTKEKIVGSVPAHVHTENERWVSSTKKQNLLKAKRLTKKLSKTPARKGR